MSHDPWQERADQAQEPLDETLPEVVKAFLRSGATLERICLQGDGRWTYQGRPVEHERVASLFSRSVSRTPGGTWVLSIGRFVYPIEVQDTAYFIERLVIDEAGVSAHLSDQTQEPLALHTLSYAGQGRLYVQVKGGQHRARLLRPAYYALAPWLQVDDAGQISVSMHGQRVTLALMDDEP